MGGMGNGLFWEIGFDIIVVLEIMVILCLCENCIDLKMCFGNIFIGFIYDWKLVYVCDFGV